jgi:hypothetical protein
MAGSLQTKREKNKMARFNLEDYETVEERLKRANALHEDLRVVTHWENNNSFEPEPQPGPKTWVVRASIYLTAGDQAAGLPKATGYAVEIDGTGGANNGSALENAETSAIGRALANMNLSGNKRASRQEMEKVVRIEQTDWLAEAGSITDKAELRGLYIKAKSQGAPAEVLGRLKDIAAQLDDGETEGTSGSLQPGKS